MMRLQRIAVASFLGALLVATMTSAASACAVCMTGKEDDTRIAFELMTAFMTVIPFVIGGGVFWWLRGRLKEIEAMHERAREGGTSLAAARDGGPPSLKPVDTTTH